MSERTDKLKKIIAALSHAELEIIRSYVNGAAQVSNRTKKKPRQK